MKFEAILTLNDVTLRALQRADIEPLRQLRNENRQFFFDTGCIAPEQQAAWFDAYERKPNDYMFAVGLAAMPHTFAGAAALYDIRNGRAEAGRFLIDKRLAPQKGVGTSMILCVCCFGFQTLGLREIYVQIRSDNIASIRACEKAGFRATGKQADAVRVLTQNAQQFQTVITEYLDKKAGE